MKEKELFVSGTNRYIERIKREQEIYFEVLDSIPDEYDKKIYMIESRELFNKVISNFVTSLDQDKAEGDLMKIYDIAVHMKTKALIIANKGATLYSITEKYETPNLVRHIGAVVYMPGLGQEYVNVGLVGNVYDNKVVLRTESACTPSFLFGSQRCNCHYQWKNIRELAAYFNKCDTPSISDGDKFEAWVQEQYKYENGKHIYQQPSNLGFVLLHVDSQNGMGSGYTKDEFVFDLSERASLRHRGEYTSEQTYKTTMYGGFTTIGINGDPRSEDDSIGYKITPVIMDYLHVSEDIIMLTNNPLKIRQMEDAGYKITRVKSIGAVNVAGSTEATQRGTEFHHLDIDGELTSFKEDYERIKSEIIEIVGD